MNRLAWRFLYWCLDQHLTVRLAAASIAVAATLFGEGRAEGLVSAFERRFVLSGWPHHREGWVNLHLSRFVWRIRRVGRQAPQVAVMPVAARTPVRIGCVGRFRGLLSFPKALFAALPAGAQLHLFDLEYNGACAEYLSDVATEYVPINAAPHYVDAAAQAINAAGLDVLVNANSKIDAYDLVDRVATPCIMNFCPGSDFLHHDRVAFQLNGQPEADYFPVGRGLFCGTTGTFFGSVRVFPTRGYYDPRDMARGPHPPWSARKPLIVFHGSLYKLAHEDVLDCLFGLLADDSSVRFVVMGKDARGALERITRAGARWGVAARVHYEGVFDSTRSEGGVVADAGWQRLCRFLGDARLAPDPWPVGGGSSRFEAFAMGVPSVHMGVRTDPASRGRPQPSVVEVPHMMVRQAVAWSVDEYRALCERCLRDEAFAAAVMETELSIARELSDPARLWRQILECYREWLQSIGARVTHIDALLESIDERLSTPAS